MEFERWFQDYEITGGYVTCSKTGEVIPRIVIDFASIVTDKNCGGAIVLGIADRNLLDEDNMLTYEGVLKIKSSIADFFSELMEIMADIESEPIEMINNG